MTKPRTPPDCGYITSPGRTVRALVTDLGILEKDGDELVLTAVAPGVSVDDVRASCGWELRRAGDIAELTLPEHEEVLALRRWDPQGWFLRA